MGVLRGTGNDTEERRSGTRHNASMVGIPISSCDRMDVYQENEELKEELQKLAAKVEFFKILGMLTSNRHLKAGGKTGCFSGGERPELYLPTSAPPTNWQPPLSHPPLPPSKVRTASIHRSGHTAHHTLPRPLTRPDNMQAMEKRTEFRGRSFSQGRKPVAINKEVYKECGNGTKRVKLPPAENGSRHQIEHPGSAASSPDTEPLITNRIL